MYAVKGRNKTSFAILSLMTAAQLAYGVLYVVIFRRDGEEAFFYLHPDRCEV